MNLYRSLAPLGLLALATQPNAWATSACADAQTMVDTREDAPFKESGLDAEARAAIVREALGDARVEASISSGAVGAFTRVGARETAYVVQRVNPAASPVDPIDAVLIVLEGGKPVRRVATSLGQRPDGVLHGVGTAGTDALLLRADVYAMGQSSSRLVLVDLVGERLVERARFDEARVETCDDARFGGFVEAIRVIRCGNAQPPTAWQVERVRAQCVDAKPPPAQAFKAVVQGKP